MYFARACAQVVQLRRGLATSEDYERLSHSHVLALPLHDFTLRPLIAAVRISLAETTTRSSPPLQPSARTLPRARLPVASRRVRACARREASCHFDRCLPQPGVQLRFSRRRAVPSRDYLCPGAPAGPATITCASVSRVHARVTTTSKALHHVPKVHAWLDRFLRRWVAAELTID